MPSAWERRSAVWSFAPLALAVCAMLPRLASAQFGLLDDGFMLATGRALIGHWSNAFHLIPETGRFFPAHWLAYAVLVAALGSRPLAFFAVNTLLLAGVLAMLMRLARLVGGTRWDAAIAAMLFALSGPALETFYTLSKPEPLQLSWIALSLLVTAASVTARTRRRRAGWAAVAACALLLADATKETGVALVPISLGWLAAERWWLRDRGTGLAFARRYAALAVAAAIAFGAMRWHFAPVGLAEGWYTRAYSVEPRMLGAAVFRMLVWLARDFAYLPPAAALAVGSLVRGGPSAPRRLLAYGCVWMAGWLAVYAPWPVTFEYYLAPFALGGAVVAGIIVGDAARRLRERRLSPAGAIGTSAALAATGLLWAATAVNAVADARVQLAVDRANAGLVEFLATLPARSRVAVNTPWLDEYVVELPRHLVEIQQRGDIGVEHLPRARPGAPPAAVFVATPALVDPPVPTVRIPFDAAGVRRVDAALDTVLGGRGRLVYRAGERQGILEVGLHRVLCRIAKRAPAYRADCALDRPLIRVLAFSYGWQVHRVTAQASGTGRTDPVDAENHPADARSGRPPT